MGTLKSSMYIFVFRMASLPSGLVGACKPGVTTFVRISGNSKHEKYRLKECHATPYAIASVGVINKSIQWLKRDHPHDSLAEFVFEEGDNLQGDLMFLWITSAKNPRLERNLPPIQIQEFRAVASV